MNLYPFEATVARDGATLQEAIEQIDIGGVSLLRAASKNFDHVAVLSDPAEYDAFVAALPQGGLDHAARRRCATRAFERTAEYDSAIARYLESGLLANELPGSLALTIPIEQPLRYGENPQDRAAFYLARTAQLPEQLGGKALSYNNLLDLDATLRLLVRASTPARSRPAPAACRRASCLRRRAPDRQAHRAVRRRGARDRRRRGRAALDADPVSAYGGIIAVDGASTPRRRSTSPNFFWRSSPRRTSTRTRWSACARRRTCASYVPRRRAGAIARELRVRSALGGVLAEDDDPQAPPERWSVVSKRQPTPSSGAISSSPGTWCGT